MPTIQASRIVEPHHPILQPIVHISVASPTVVSVPENSSFFSIIIFTTVLLSVQLLKKVDRKHYF